MTRKHIDPKFVTIQHEDGRTIKLTDFIAFIQDKDDAYYRDFFKPENHDSLFAVDGHYHKIEAEVGKKYIRIVQQGVSQRCVHFFIDFAGNIYKSATYKAPAKHVRGSIFEENHSWGRALSTYGAAYLR